MINFANVSELNIDRLPVSFDASTTGVKLQSGQKPGAEIGDLSRLSYVLATAKVELNNDSSETFEAKFKVYASGVEIGALAATIQPGRSVVKVPANTANVGGGASIDVEISVESPTSAAASVQAVTSLLVTHPVIIAVASC